MIIKAVIKDVTKTNDPDFIKYNKEAIDNGIDTSKSYVVVNNNVVIGTATIKYNFPVLEIEAECLGYITTEHASEFMLEGSGLVCACDENRNITKWDLCNFTLRHTEDGEISNIVEILDTMEDL